MHAIDSAAARAQLLIGLIPLTAALCGAVAHADPVLQEVVVTAQKREQNLQDTPISLAVFDNTAIEKLGITNIGDLAGSVPNFRILPFGVSPTTLRIFIRGVGPADSQITQDPPVGIYINGVYVARPIGLTLDIADIERIEVLRGPQGTLYGRNTTGGAINVITQKPAADFGFSQLVSLGNYNLRRSQTLVNVPVTDTLSMKAAYEFNRRDGFIENSGEGRDFSAFSRRAGRFDVRWQPAEGWTVDYAYDRAQSDFTGAYYHLGAVSPGFAGVLEAQPDRVSRAALPNRFRGSEDESLGHALTVAVNTAIGEIKSISAYREARQNAYQDYSANPVISIYRNNPLKVWQEQFSQELQLVGSNAAKTFDYATGLYYFEERGAEIALDQIDLIALDLPRHIGIDNSTWAVYGQFTARPSAESPWALTLGGRYTRDERAADNHVQPEASVDFGNFTPSLTVDYRASDAVKLYGKIVSGYKSGGFNMRQSNFTEAFDEEKLVSYELGWKTDLFERRARWNGAFFYADYSDIQLDILLPNQIVPVLTQTRNAGKAVIYGAETDFDIAVTDSLRLQLSYAWLRSDIREVEGDDKDLYHLPNAPEHSLSATVDWDIAQTAAGTLNLSVNYSWRDEMVTGVRELPGLDIDTYALTDLRLSLIGADWIGRGDFRVAAWVKNLFDEEYYSDTFGTSAVFTRRGWPPTAIRARSVSISNIATDVTA